MGQKKTVTPNNGQFDLFATPGTGEFIKTEDVSGYNTIKNSSHIYQFVDTPFSRELLLNNLLQQKSVCFDTETTGLKALEVELIGIAFFMGKRERLLCVVSRRPRRNTTNSE